MIIGREKCAHFLESALTRSLSGDATLCQRRFSFFARCFIHCGSHKSSYCWLCGKRWTPKIVVLKWDLCVLLCQHIFGGCQVHQVYLRHTLYTLYSCSKVHIINLQRCPGHLRNHKNNNWKHGYVSKPCAPSCNHCFPYYSWLLSPLKWLLTTITLVG